MGSLLCLKWPRIAYLHVPLVLWGAGVNIFQYRCPLTNLELWLRYQTAPDLYENGFFDHYLTEIVYPQSLSSTHFVILGVGLLLLNTLIYGFLYRQRKLVLVSSDAQ